MPASTCTGYYLTQNSQDLRLRRPFPGPRTSSQEGGNLFETDTTSMDAPASMAPIIPATMTAGSMWRTANTLTQNGQGKMSTGDCYRGFTTHEFRENPEQPDFSFEEIERDVLLRALRLPCGGPERPE